VNRAAANTLVLKLSASRNSCTSVGYTTYWELGALQQPQSGREHVLPDPPTVAGSPLNSDSGRVYAAGHYGTTEIGQAINRCGGIALQI